MGIGRRTDFNILVSQCCKKVLPFWGAFFSLLLAGQAQEFNIRTISREGLINRDPVVSETGLIAWMYYDTNTALTAYSHIAVYQDGKTNNLTDGLATFYGATKPLVHSNQLIFIANAKSVGGDVTWSLREVPTRDEGDARELNAVFSATEIGGVQKIERLGSAAETTNEAGEIVVPIIGEDTNGSPRRLPSGEAEVWSWKVGDADIQRVTQDSRNDFAPSFWGNTISWQKAKGWPFGWEIMALVGDTRMQLTTNFYYDMGPKVFGTKVVWYGWDGFDYEIYMFDSAKSEITQLTSNRFDDTAPMIWGDVVVWEGYSAVEADIYMWKEGNVTLISSNIDDDLNPKIWNNFITWQGFDGDDFEIYLYDITKGGEAIKITSNDFDDTSPDIHDNLITWMGYFENWDAEIFYLDIRNFSSSDIKQPVRLTDNEEDDRDPKTAGRRIVWVSESEGESRIQLAEPN